MDGGLEMWIFEESENALQDRVNGKEFPSNVSRDKFRSRSQTESS